MGSKFNPSKCVIMQCQRGNMDWSPVGSLQYYHIHGADLPTVDTHRNLGVLVDNSLRFHAHIQTTVNKAAGLANNLLRSTLCRSSNFMLTLYKTHIRTLLEFASTVWNTGYACDLKLL
ncbi:hypothetical protein Pcinc_019451 [Petrolisthes cinctipes]|uniref:Uncharacterized protein n=1 Tax=Petrolisthes cinctipes TaxID=88211 RepID=A0AAE1FKZ0_PETCI|nr:hypothetical protein Pcinc_019451 [Petrolisthes cinctipes]